MKKTKYKIGNSVKHNKIELNKVYRFKEKTVVDNRETVHFYLAKVTKEYNKYFLIKKYPEESYGKPITSTILKAKMIMGYISVYELV